MSDWKTAGGRLSLLPSVPIPAALPSALDLYRRVWSEEPESFQKPSNPLMASVAQGNHGDLTFACMVHPTRIDFTFSPLTQFQDPATAQFPLIADATQLLDELLRCTALIGRGLVPDAIFRAAVGLQVINVRASFADANRVLAGLLPTQYSVRLADEEDFILQVNRPYPMPEDRNLMMNALTKWSVDRLKIVTFALAAQGIPNASASVAAQPTASEFIAASITFDNNNVATNQPLAPAKQASVLSEALAASMRMVRTMGLNVEGFQNADIPQ